MSDHIPKIPKPTGYTKKPKAKTTDRGYGSVHQKLRLMVIADQVGICLWCHQAWASELHHLDHRPSNTKRENLVALCPKCHQEYHKAH
jgi:5-methylcytosine-specific restriction endonuclease McrA